MKDYHRAVLEITAAAILFGLIPIIVRYSTLDSYTLALGRVFFAVLFLFVWVKFTKRKLQKLSEKRSQLFLFGLLHALTIIFFFVAIKLIPTAIAVLLLYAGAVYLVVLSHFFLKEKIERITLVSLVISLFGLLLIFYTRELILNWWGYLAGFLAGLCMAWVFLIGKIIRREYDQFSMVFYQNIIALPIMLPLILFSQFTFTFENISILIFLGFFCTTIAFLLLYSGMKIVKGQKLGILLLMEVVVPIVLSLMLFREIPGIMEAIGGVLIFVGYVAIVLFHKEE